MNYDIKHIGERIRKYRIQNGYTQEKLACELRIDRSLLSHIEAGKRGCSVDLLVQLSECFRVSLDLLVFGKDNDSTNANNLGQLKSDIAKLIKYLETFNRSL